MLVSKKVAILCLMVTLISSANGVCTLINPVCGLLNPILPLCSLTQLLGLCGGDQLIVLQLTSGKLSLDLNVGHILGLKIIANPLSLGVTVDLLQNLNIDVDLELSGPVSLHVGVGALIQIGGNLSIASGSILENEGILKILGNTIINGNLHLAGALSNNHIQTAWISSPHPVTLGGTPAKPASISGNGGVDADVITTGTTSSGNFNDGANSVYYNRSLTVSSSSILTVYGTAIVNGLSSVNGRLHLGGIKTTGQQSAWFKANTTELSGTETNKARITGNGGIDGDVILGEYAGVAAGNSPGVQSYNGNLQMSATSFMEIEVEGPGGAQFDQYIVDRTLHRNGILYINFIGGYIPGLNDRFNFGSHFDATGTFNTVYTNANDVVAAYSMRSTSFVYKDPILPSYCTCVLATV